MKLLSAFILAAFLVFTLSSFQPVDGQLTGDGSAENPYSGTVTTLEHYAYYAIGTTFDVEVDKTSSGVTAHKPYSYEHFGLYFEGDHLKGTLTASGVCTIPYSEVAHEGCTILVPHDYEGGRINSKVVGLWRDVIGTIADEFVALENIRENNGNVSDSVDPDMEPNNNECYEVTFDYFGIDTEMELWLDMEKLSSMMEDYGYVFGPHNLSILNQDYANYEITVEVESITNNIVGEYCWTPTYFLSDGSVVDYIVEVAEIYDDTGLPEINEPVKEGYTFTGWYTADGSEWEFATLDNWMDPDWAMYFANPVRIVYAGWEPVQSPFSATSGSGTIDDPYSGLLTVDGYLKNASYLPSEVWVEQGTEFDVSLDEVPSVYSFSIDAGFGLDVTSSIATGYRITGTATVPGDCVFVMPHPLEEGSEKRITFHIVGSYSVLEFISEPDDPLYATITYSKT